MSKYIDADLLRAEIERLEGENNCGTSDFIEAKRIAYNQVKKVLDTLPEQPVEGLEEEIQEYMSNEDNNPFDWDWRDKRDCARHFAEWGADHLRSVTKMVHDGLEEDYE